LHELQVLSDAWRTTGQLTKWGLVDSRRHHFTLFVRLRLSQLRNIERLGMARTFAFGKLSIVMMWELE
jgi:hypothetical protein